MSWLKDLKQGDEVVIREGGFARLTGVPHYTLDTVTKVTKTQLLVGRHRYMVSTGYRYGSVGDHRPRLQQATPEMREIALADARFCRVYAALRYLEKNEKRLPDDVAALVLQAYEKLREHETK